MKSKELNELSIIELEKKKRDFSEELLNLKLRKQTGQVEAPHELNKLRKDIARVNTIISEKEK
tara:strand:- start:482 stop:670 length:189 start_codon:yes stop_codon:yes gene_type:complete